MQILNLLKITSKITGKTEIELPVCDCLYTKTGKACQHSLQAQGRLFWWPNILAPVKKLFILTFLVFIYFLTFIMLHWVTFVPLFFFELGGWEIHLKTLLGCQKGRVSRIWNCCLPQKTQKKKLKSRQSRDSVITAIL